MTAIDCDVWMAATGVAPESQRVVWPTKPWPSTPVIPASGAALVVVVDVVADELVVDEPDEDGEVVVTVVVLGGAASGERGVVSVSPPEKTSTDARIAASPNSATVAATSATWVRLNFDVPGVR